MGEPVFVRRPHLERGRVNIERDVASEARDALSVDRDDVANARDRRAEALESSAGGRDVAAAAARAAARSDRRGGANDRRGAASDRRAARADRLAAAEALASTAIDGLTGALRRDTGSVELEREAIRADRAGQVFVVAFVDVVGLKLVNDRHGHAAGDEVLQHTTAAIRSSLRSYDLVVRFGGDEFVCGLVDLSMDDAGRRFLHANAALTRFHRPGITVGIAERRSGEPVVDVIARADADLYRQRSIKLD